MGPSQSVAPIGFLSYHKVDSPRPFFRPNFQIIPPSTPLDIHLVLVDSSHIACLLRDLRQHVFQQQPL
jgi:hypothetical protein